MEKENQHLGINGVGKHIYQELLAIIDDKNNYYKYTCCRRRNDTYTKRANQITLLEKNKNNVIPIETKLSNYSSRTYNQTNYTKFIKHKNKSNKQLKIFYEKMLFRKLKFRIYSRTKQSEHKLLNEIENKFLTQQEKQNNKKIVLMYGDWSQGSGYQMKSFMPTPNIAIKKVLETRFTILDVNEYNTSKIYNKTLTELVNIKVRKGNHNKKIHEVLTLKEETERRIFVNRDKNACKNILYIAKSYLKNQTRPKIFCRQKKNQTKIQ